MAKRTGPRASEGVENDGAERYMWVFREGSSAVLSVPGIRDLTMSAEEARNIGQMLIDVADDIDSEKVNSKDSQQ